eukprot:TRINITY_DN7332_c0_g1_i1.p1 TRINITY_DN7332_c0_g1~~TRINITY_DN7332_c0_g1_i1.p1  ORF type:complete len:605 (+),score=103.27 TRINITY_DN7332_c0_g1_i1:60-1874(+)
MSESTTTHAGSGGKNHNTHSSSKMAETVTTTIQHNDSQQHSKRESNTATHNFGTPEGDEQTTEVRQDPRLKRSKSIGNISELTDKLQRLEDFIYDLPSKIASDIRKMPSRLAERRKSIIDWSRGKKVPVDNKMEGSDYPQSPVDAKTLLVLLLPFLPVFLYSLVVFFSSVFLFIYMLIIVLYFTVLVAWFIAEVAIRPPWYKPTKPAEGLTREQLPAYWQGIWHNPKHDLHLEYEDIEFSTTDNLKLRGWFVPAPANHIRNHNIGIVLVHGGGRDRRAWLRHVPLFHDQGYDVMLFDFSEHGCSDGSRRGFSYGIREKEDVKFAARWMKEVKGIQKIVAIGTSVGGASVIMAAAEDSTIDAVIAENPVSCAEEFALFHLKRMVSSYVPNTYGFLLAPVYSIISRVFLFRIGAFFGYDRPYQVIEKISPRPVMLMHGTADDLVPKDHSENLYEVAKEPKELWLATNAWHCALYDMYPVEFGMRVHSFLHKYLHQAVVEQKGGVAGESDVTVSQLSATNQRSLSTITDEKKEKEAESSETSSVVAPPEFVVPEKERAKREKDAPVTKDTDTLDSDEVVSVQTDEAESLHDAAHPVSSYLKKAEDPQ